MLNRRKIDGTKFFGNDSGKERFDEDSTHAVAEFCARKTLLSSPVRTGTLKNQVCISFKTTSLMIFWIVALSFSLVYGTCHENGRKFAHKSMGYG